MNLRQQRLLRATARRLPVLRSYEKRIAEATQSISDLDAAFAEYRAANRLWAPVGHFYSPFVDVSAAHDDLTNVHRQSLTELPAINLRLVEQSALLAEMTEFASSVEFCRTEADAVERNHRYWSDNPAFGDADARFLTSVLHHFRPSRLIELGCGYSSAVTLDARDRFLEQSMSVTFVDPYPQLLEALIRESDRESVVIRNVRTQDFDLDQFDALGPNDVLFVDSTHVAKTGSDVNQIIFEILPRLNSGVLIHFHDVFPHFEYPPPWVLEHRAWTEQYVLRAFLQYNRDFDIVLWPGLLWALDPAALESLSPSMRQNAGGSVWLRKV